ncbi:TrmH family RNA methyltransferase [Paenibacillus sp. y28]|uniref:TrmH family RNA methyltransferase n=1 Tax=Paenibacillus sp. y28 TaxID=3129110 RepID=UPI00301B3EC2
METIITSVQNPRVKTWSQLLDRKGREKQGRFIIEGTHLVVEALRSAADIETILVSPFARGAEELQQAWHLWQEEHPGHSLEWVEVSDEILVKCSDAQTPQPVLAILRKPDQAADALFELGDAPLVVVVDGVQDPGNLGTIIRSCDAAGADAVVLGRGTVDLYNPKTVRSTMGSLFHLPIVQADLIPLLTEARSRGIRIVSTSLQAQQTCYETDWREGAWIVVGHEANGVSAGVTELVDTSVIIPMRGQAESLNVAMAATIMLFEATRQRYFAG